MSHFFVIGGIYEDPNGNQRFALVRPEPGEPPFVMGDSVMSYFRLIWNHAHLYRVEEDYTLALVAASSEALRGGVRAPERVTPELDLLEELQEAIKLS